MVAELHNRRVVRMPDLVGHPLKKVRHIITNASLDIDAVLFRESYEDSNLVLEQSPARGQMVYEGTQVTLWVARRGYMELLPAIYRRSDALGRNVVRDVCFIFEHLFGAIEEKLDESHAYFDPYECPPEFLDWLASWTAMVVDMDWQETKKRAVLKRGVDIYRIRGTMRGLKLVIKLFTGHEPHIEENKWPFKGFRVGVEARIGHDSVILPPVHLARCFMITMPVKFTDVSPEMVIRIHELIQMERPAHTHYYLQFDSDKGETELREFFSIGLRSGIGIGAEVLEQGDVSGAEATAVETAFVESTEPATVSAEGPKPKPPSTHAPETKRYSKATKPAKPKADDAADDVPEQDTKTKDAPEKDQDDE